MGEAITESAHYVAVVRGGGTDLFLIQGGRLEASGTVSILWDRRAEAEATGARPPGMLSAARRRAFRILSRVF